MAGGVPIGSAYLNAEATKIFIHKPVLPTEEYKFKVSDDEKNTLFLVKGASTNFHKQRVLTDSSGRTILTLRMKWRTMHQRWQAFRGASTEAEDLIFTTKNSSASSSLEGSDLHVCRGYSDCVSYSVRHLGNLYVIDQFNAGTTHYMAMVNGDTAAVNSNVDMAFTVSLMAIMDAMIEQKQQGLTADLIASKFFLPGLLPSFDISEVLEAWKSIGELLDSLDEALEYVM